MERERKGETLEGRRQRGWRVGEREGAARVIRTHGKVQDMTADLVPGRGQQ